MRKTQERPGFIKRADETIIPVTVSIDDKGNVAVIDAREPGETASIWKLVFGNSPPKTSEDKLEFLQDDPDIHKVNEDSQQLMCRGCSRTLMFDYPHRINIASWLRHKVICKVVQKQYEKQYLEGLGSRLQIKEEEDDDIPLAQITPPRNNRITRPPRAPTRKTLEEEGRKKILDNDPLTGQVEESRVWCKPCGRWIGGTIGIYSLVNWRIHRKARHENNIPQPNKSRLVQKSRKPSAIVQSSEKKKSKPKFEKEREERGRRFSTMQVQRKRRRIESEDEEETDDELGNIEVPPKKSVKLENDGPSWFERVASGFGHLWSIWLDTE